MATNDEIKRRLFANPLFWVDKQVALETALEDGTIPVGDSNLPYVVSELAEARFKITAYINSGKITQAEVDAEIERLEDNE